MHGRKKIRQKCKFIEFKNNRLHYRYKECNKPYTKWPNEAIKNFDKFFLLLGKGVYPYQYMDSWERFNETSIPPKEAYMFKVILYCLQMCLEI